QLSHKSRFVLFVFFFFQAEDGIRDSSVTGVQTCALPISIALAIARARSCQSDHEPPLGLAFHLSVKPLRVALVEPVAYPIQLREIGRARVGKECRSRGALYN